VENALCEVPGLTEPPRFSGRRRIKIRRKSSRVVRNAIDEAVQDAISRAAECCGEEKIPATATIVEGGAYSQHQMIGHKYGNTAT
jgi:hypothetical protein